MKEVRRIQTLSAAVICLFCCGCQTSSSPTDAREMATAKQQFAFQQSAPMVKSCLLPVLDQLKLFPLDPLSTRPSQVRDLGNKTEIFAQDAMTTLYVVDIEAVGAKTTEAKSYAHNAQAAGQIAEAMKRCGAR